MKWTARESTYEAPRGGTLNRIDAVSEDGSASMIVAGFSDDQREEAIAALIDDIAKRDPGHVIENKQFFLKDTNA